MMDCNLRMSVGFHSNPLSKLNCCSYFKRRGLRKRELAGVSSFGKPWMAEERASVRGPCLFALFAFLLAIFYSIYCFTACHSRALLVCSLVGSVVIALLVFYITRVCSTG